MSAAAETLHVTQPGIVPSAAPARTRTGGITFRPHPRPAAAVGGGPGLTPEGARPTRPRGSSRPQRPDVGEGSAGSTHACRTGDDARRSGVPLHRHTGAARPDAFRVRLRWISARSGAATRRRPRHHQWTPQRRARLSRAGGFAGVGLRASRTPLGGQGRCRHWLPSPRKPSSACLRHLAHGKCWTPPHCAQGLPLVSGSKRVAARWHKHSPRRDAALPWLPMTRASGCAR